MLCYEYKHWKLKSFLNLILNSAQLSGAHLERTAHSKCQATSNSQDSHFYDNFLNYKPLKKEANISAQQLHMLTNTIYLNHIV